MKFIRSILLIILMFFSGTGSCSSDDYKLEVALIYKISKFVYWPNGVTNNLLNDHFGVCVLGNESLTEKLAILKKRKIKSFPVEVYSINYSDEINSQCQVLFIDPSRKAFIEVILKQLESQAILTLSTFPGFAESGGMIEFNSKMDSIGFTINLDKIKYADLDINSALLNFAT